MLIMYAGKGKPELLVFTLPERKEEVATSHCWQKYSIPSIPKRVRLWRIFRSPTVTLRRVADPDTTLEKELWKQCHGMAPTRSPGTLQAAPIPSGVLQRQNHQFTRTRFWQEKYTIAQKSYYFSPVGIRVFPDENASYLNYPAVIYKYFLSLITSQLNVYGRTNPNLSFER